MLAAFPERWVARSTALQRRRVPAGSQRVARAEFIG
jgi:hypothetical protein